MDNANLPPMHGMGVAIYLISLIFVAFSVATVGLRTYVRWSEKLLWWDDGLMLLGLIVFVAQVAISCRSVYFGVGYRIEDLTDYKRAHANKYLTIWMLLYSVCLLSVKSSICITVLRLSETLKYVRFSIYALLALCVSASLISIIGGITQCRPGSTDGTCSSWDAVYGIAYTTTVITIITDIACAILPAIILWKTQLRLRTKALVCILLSFGSFASVCAIVRMPLIKYYGDPQLLYYVAIVILWSNIEIGVGLIAGSIPVLQRLIMSRMKKQKIPHSPIPVDLVTFGSTPVKTRRHVGGFNNPTDTGFSMVTVHASHPSRDWERLDDDSSVGTCVIRTDYTVDVDIE
ncbi:uncharacterized protein F4822DRAFT_351166 [Hypoxylon trugodes]|uniref:uncharacterized protein n=1 Tax=Hypoxylon trugodes TaxID=326681 RepID=UPI00219CA90A|nr:uncharacterized protein F4822DRAFT_351166 [Hypoxylon trugodes]KAI1385678.1 hypothetical protein F4822DRAFT_351166 [Hypoxylon trugodes]